MISSGTDSGCKGKCLEDITKTIPTYFTCLFDFFSFKGNLSQKTWIINALLYLSFPLSHAAGTELCEIMVYHRVRTRLKVCDVLDARNRDDVSWRRWKLCDYRNNVRNIISRNIVCFALHRIKA